MGICRQAENKKDHPKLLQSPTVMSYTLQKEQDQHNPVLPQSWEKRQPGQDERQPEAPCY